MRIGKFGVGDLVREDMEHEGERWNPPDVGLVIKWSDNGWLVDFPAYGNIFWMNPNNLELVSEAR